MIPFSSGRGDFKLASDNRRRLVALAVLSLAAGAATWPERVPLPAMIDLWHTYFDARRGSPVRHPTGPRLEAHPRC